MAVAKIRRRFPPHHLTASPPAPPLLATPLQHFPERSPMDEVYFRQAKILRLYSFVIKYLFHILFQTPPVIFARIFIDGGYPSFFALYPRYVPPLFPPIHFVTLFSFSSSPFTFLLLCGKAILPCISRLWRKSFPFKILKYPEYHPTITLDQVLFPECSSSSPYLLEISFSAVEI